MTDTCPNCYFEVEFIKTIEDDKVLYGEPPDQVPINVVIPVYNCPACGYAYTDGEAEEIRDKATEYLRRI